jgi:hypothetical protein
MRFCNPKSFFIILVLFLYMGLTSGVVKAGEKYPLQGPLLVRNQNPLYLLFLSPRAEDSSVVPHKELKLTFIGPYSNLYEDEFNAGAVTDISLDMEIFRPSFLFQYGFLEGWEVGMELAFMSTTGGFLDPFIQGFHNAFNFPNGGRENRRNGDFEYNVQSKDGVDYEVDNQPFGLSDITLSLKHHIFDETQFGKYSPGVASTMYVKLPTGMPSRGLGSGRPDFGFNFALDKSFWRMGSYLNLGLVILGGHEDLSPILRAAAMTWMLGLEFVAIKDYLNIFFQLNGDSSAFGGTGISQLSHGTLDLIVGLSGEVGERFFWQFGFTEDPDINGPSIDFTTTFVLGTRWDLSGIRK